MKEPIIKEKLEKNGYYITQKWGLILEKGQEEIIADMRTNRTRNSIFNGDANVALSQKTLENSASIEKLEDVLKKEGIPYYQTRVGHYLSEYSIKN